MNIQKSIEESISHVYFLITESLYNSLQSYCSDQFIKYNDPFFKFWLAFAIYKQGSIPEAINELNTISNKREIQFSVLSFLDQLHSQSQLVDEDQQQSIKFQIESCRVAANDRSLMITARYYMYTDQMDQAQNILQSIQMGGNDIKVCEAWINMNTGDYDQAMSTFQTILQEGTHLESLFGMSRVCQKKKKYSEALDAINEIIVYYEDNLTVQIEKTKILMIINDWDQALETIHKVQYIDPDNLIIKKIELFHCLAIEGDTQKFIQQFQYYIEMLKKQEPRNPDFIYNNCRLFSRICSRNKVIIKILIKLLQECRKQQPINSEFVIELAYQHILLSDYNTSYQYYQEAAALDETKIEALTGMIQCKVLQNEVEDAVNQIEFVNEIQIDGRTSHVAYLEALLNFKRGKIQEAIKFVDEALKLHIQMIRQLEASFNFFIKFNPDYLIELSQLYQYEINLNGLLENTKYNTVHVGKGNKLLETVLKQIPGNMQGLVLLARGKISVGDQGKASEQLNKVQQIDDSSMDLAILNGIIMLQSANERTALNSLEQSISNNFQIRENLLFLLIKGKLEFKIKEYDESIRTLEEALQIMNSNNKMNKQDSNDIFGFTDQEKCLLYTNLARAYGVNKNIEKAKEIVNLSIQEFAGTDQEMKVLLINSEIAILSNDVKKALSILRAVNTDSIYYSESRKLMADVYLSHLKDRRNYSKCYRDLVQQSPSLENYKLYGKAMLSIQEPEEALQAFQQAQTYNKQDQEIIFYIGQSLTQGHYYNPAIKYYQDILKSQPKPSYKLELGCLLMKTKQLNEANKILSMDNFVDDFNAITYQDMKINVKGLLACYKLQIKMQGHENYKSNTVAQSCLEKSISLQADLIEKGKEQGINIQNDKIELGQIYYQLAEHFYLYEKNAQKAMACLDRSKKYLLENEKVLSLSCSIYYKAGDKVNSEQKCLQLLKIFSNSDYGTYLYSEILIQKQQSEQAIQYFMNMFKNNNKNYRILQRLIELECRYGNIDNCLDYIQQSEQNGNNLLDQGLCYCKGIYYKYKREPEKALVEFNKSKRSSDYREQAIWQMIMIYLNPYQELWISQSNESQGIQQVQQDVIDCCQQLLKELYEKSQKQRILQALLLLMDDKDKKQNHEQAMKSLTELCKDNSEYIPGLLFLTISKFMNGKNTEAKNHLKILSKKQYSSEFHDEIEMAWLLHADTFVGISKFDNAEEILRKCLKFNKSCGKAEEYMGLIGEKENSYVDAAMHYEKAFLLTNHKSLSIGYRLAFNYFKVKKFIECVEICQKILKVQPKYPKIEKELLIKARQMIRQ